MRLQQVMARSTISMLNDGVDGNGFGARVTPVRVCYDRGCGPTYEAYLFINGDENESETTWAQRTAESKGVPLEELDEKLYSMNMSYGGGGGSADSNACEKLAEISESGILVASSSGNSGINSTSWPAACPTVFSVAATNGTHRRSSYSSTNQYVDFAAPGGEYSDWNDDGIDDLVYAYALFDNSNPDVEMPLSGLQGTSMASPHGAGFLALLKYYYEDVAKPFEIYSDLPAILKYNHVEQLLKANLITNDVNKESREFDTTARPGRDDHLGYGIIDLHKAIKSIDAFKSGYFTSFDALPSYEGPSLIKLNAGEAQEFTLTPKGVAGDGFNNLEYTFQSEFLEVKDLGNLNYSVVNAPDYTWAGWVDTPITFTFPMEEGADLPFEGYELLAVGVNVLFHIKGEATSVDIPDLKAYLIDEEDQVLQESRTDLIGGEGALGFNEVEPGNYKLKVCSDINGDNAWCGSGELVAESEVFEVTGVSSTEVGLELSAFSEGVPNNAPVITSDPETTDATFATVGEEYLYRVLATDEDYENENGTSAPRNWFDYSIELINEEDGSTGNFLSIDVIGEVTGVPKEKHIGSWKVKIGVSDRIDTTYQEFILTVDE